MKIANLIIARNGKNFITSLRRNFAANVLRPSMMVKDEDFLPDIE
jgi:hypothetical protein